MFVPEDLYYTESHEWIRMDGDIATMGITDFAQGEMGEVVFVDLPDTGSKVTAGEPCGSIETPKAVEDIICPVSGKVEKRNTDLEDSPDLINKSPYEEGWLIKIKLSDPDDLQNLLSALEYKKLLDV